MKGIDVAEKQLLERDRIAIHYNDEFHINSKKYNDQSSSFKKAHNALQDIGKNGTLIMFEYNNPFVFHIAEIAQGTMIEPMIFYSNKEKIVYKTMKYINRKTFNYSEYPLLAALKPPFSTICSRSENIDKLVHHLYFKNEIPVIVENLHPKMLEQLCEAYLRSEFVPSEIQLLTTSIKTGKTMPWVDLVGYSKSKKIIYSQITYASESESLKKAKGLVSFVKENGLAILFSNDNRKIVLRGLDYHFLIKDVFKSFNESKNSVYPSMLKAMIGIKILE
ncbi:MAG: hypothetical protein ABI462_04925 [Ignavibacteria bacterium]